jgi:peptidoglycan/LPS O-acetylase OafA/YrhL
MTGGIGENEPAYRADLDGLRAVAVLLVLAFHVWPERARNGFIGVDIFLVISGYLITGIILRALEAGAFTFVGFYRRRLRRILPALIVVLAVCVAIALIVLVPRELERFGLHLAGSAASVANLVFWFEGGYFDQRPYTKPLLHLWSLGVEEQFYLLWPVALALSWKAGRRKGAAIATVLMLAASFGVNLWSSETKPIAAFYSPAGRIWELLIGGLAAFRRGKPLGPWVANACSAAGALAIAAALVVIGWNTPFPGWVAVLPVSGALLLILGGSSAWINRRILSLRPAVAIGLISYPLYLWHWPLLSFATLGNLEQLDLTSRLVLGALSIPIAWATFRFVEQPVRRGGRVTTSKLVGSMIVFIAIGWMFWIAAGFPGRAVPDAARREFVAAYRLEAREQFEEDFHAGCGFGSPNRPRAEPTLPPECTSAGSLGTWFLWGDSHAHAIANGLRLEIPAGISLAEVSTGGCWSALPGEPADSQGTELCRRSNAYAAQQIARIRPEILILVQLGGHEIVDWAGRAARLRRLGVQHVVLLGPIPRWTSPLPQIAAGRFWPTIPPFIGGELHPAPMTTDVNLRQSVGHSSVVQYLSLIAALCGSEGCRATVPGGTPRELMYFDASYLTTAGSRYVARAILVPRLSTLSGARQSLDTE